MRTRIYYPFILLIALLTTVSCENELPFSVKDNPPKLVMNALIQSPNQKIPDRKTKCVIKTHINIKQNVIFSAKLKPV